MPHFEMLRIFVRAHQARDDDVDPEAGASIIEYALLISLIALVCFAAVNALGLTTGSIVSSAATGLE